MYNRIKPLPNHREGVRELMLGEDLRVLPVISATRVSYTPCRITTYQIPSVDGFVVRCEDTNGKPVLTVGRFIPHLGIVSKITEDDTLVSHVLSSLDNDLIEWLKDIVTLKQSNLIPSGFGWDGVMTQTEYQKHTRIRNLFISPTPMSEKDQKWFDEIMDQAVRTSTLYIKTDWKNAFKLDTLTIPILRYLPTSKVYVVTFDKEGNRDIKLIRRPIIVSKDSKVRTNPTEVYTLPEGTERAILLRTNVMVDDNTTYGVSIDLFSSRPEDT